MTRATWHCAIALGIALTATSAQAQMPAASSADQEMMSGMDKMNHGMAAAPMTGNADHDFVAMMIPHHQGAVDMAQAELRYGKDSALRRLATDIVAAQNKEIAFMRRWQATHPAK
jgi:uncharacterized protein (DUF305 family)